ncbi:MAG: hypothetical protein AB7U75_14695 [Hyphomicrobiaceae bacterium]
MDKAKVIERLDVQISARSKVLREFGKTLVEAIQPFFDLMGSQEIFQTAAEYHLYRGLRRIVMKMDGDVKAEHLDTYARNELVNVAVNLVGRSTSTTHKLIVMAYVEAMAKFISNGVAEKLVR